MKFFSVSSISYFEYLEFFELLEIFFEYSHNFHSNSNVVWIDVDGEKIAGNKTNKLLSINNGGSIELTEQAHLFIWGTLWWAIKERKQLWIKW